MKAITEHVHLSEALKTIPKQDQTSSVKYQDILYYILNDEKNIHDVPIDLATAKEEVMTIREWPQANNHIGFYKQESRDTLQMLRRGEDYWYVESLITGEGFRGWVSYCRVNTRTMMEILERFFEGAPLGETEWTSGYMEGYDGKTDFGR